MLERGHGGAVAMVRLGDDRTEQWWGGGDGYHINHWLWGKEPIPPTKSTVYSDTRVNR